MPLAMALLNVSRPEYYAVDMLSKLSHDANVDVAASSIFGLGLVSAGTNNSRVAGILRQLSTFYRTEPNLLFMVRLAQGLLHAGKVFRSVYCFVLLWFMVFWSYKLMVVWYIVLWFYGLWFYSFMVHGFLVLWFYGCTVSKIYQMSISCFHQDIDLISKIFEI